MPTGDGDEDHGLRIVTNLFDVGTNFFGDFLESRLREVNFM